MSVINELFSVQNYNLIQDDDYYYFFRALNNGDHSDMQARITRDENGLITKVRTDRTRYIENPNNPEPVYEENEPISLIQVIDHIKRGHRYDTNCVSLSSNANVSVIYGNGYYHDEYAVIRVPKSKFGEQAINASEYMLLEIEKRIEEALETANDEIKEQIKKIDSAANREELLDIIANSYKLHIPNEEEITKFTAEQGTARRKIPLRGRISEYTTLTDEQNLLKNKIIAKLTLLEERKVMNQIMPHTKLDSIVIQTLGMAISSSELIHYGEINAIDENGEPQLFELSKETVHILGLLQQAIERNPDIAEKAHKIENEIIKQAIEGKEIDEKTIELLQPNETETDELPSTSIKQAYTITNGKIQYDDAQETLEKIFYLSKSVASARDYSKVINELTGNNSEYAEVIRTIANLGIDVDPKLMNRKGNSTHKISESVSIPLMKHEMGLIEAIQSMPTTEIEDIIRNPENSKNVINSLSSVQNELQIPIDEYYARAIFSKYNWQEQRIHFTQAHKESFIKKLQERKIANIYESLANAGISESSIPAIIMNLITLDREDTNKILDEIEQGNITNEILNQFQSDENEFVQPLQAEQLEDYLDFYKVEGTDIKLRDYQQSAINNVHKIFETHRFASVILPTGAGKSFVAIAELLNMQKQIEKGSNEKILYLAPSNEILEQIKKYTEKYVHGEKLNKTRDEIFKEIFPNIELATYQSLLQKDDEELRAQKYKFMVLDELHRTGAEQWGEKLNTLLDAQPESTRVLGITATPQRDVDGRNMADEVALRLGFTEQEIKNRKHIAKKMDLIDAIRLGIVVNPKIVECEYNLKNDTETLESLLTSINDMDDGPEKDEYLRKFDELRGKLNQAQEIPELLRDNIVKKDGRYIFYMPIGANEYEEDEEGNVIGRKTGADKVKQAEEQLREWLKYVDEEPEFYSMLGEYGDKKNAQQLEQFEKSTSGHTKIMIVMNKLNEGVHVSGINGIIWQRALDENSRILLMQQLGRAIYSPKEGENIGEEDRPVVIDLANNLTRVDLEKVINSYDEIDDVELLQNVIDWVNEHDGILPDINAGFKEEARLASTLKRIQKKYIKYNNDEEFDKLAEEKAEKVDAILELGSEIDLWDIKLPDRELANNKDGIKDSLYDFALKGVVKEFADFVNEINESDFVWNKKYNLLKGLIEAKGSYYGLTEEKVKEEQKKLRESGMISATGVKIQVDGNQINLGKWVATQKSQGVLKKAQGKTIEELEKDESITEKEKERIKKLLDLGIRPIERTPEEQWNYTYKLLKGLIEAKGSYYGLTEEKVKEEQKKLRESGLISDKGVKIQVDGNQINLGQWVARQKRKGVLKKAQEKTIEEIEKDESITEKEKERIKKLLDLGISPIDVREEEWNYTYKLLKGLIEAKGSYYGLTEEIVKKEQKKLRESGMISARGVKIQVDGNQINLGKWVTYQRSLGVLKKAQGKTIEELEKDESITEKEKERIKKLLELGIRPIERTPEEQWNYTYKLLKGLIEAKGSYYGLTEEKVKEEQKKLRESGMITTGVKIQVDGNQINLGKWVATQKSQGVLKKAQGKTIEELEKDESITVEEKERIKKLLELGIRPTVSKIKNQDVGKATFDANTPSCIEASTIISDLVEEKQKNQQLQ